MFQRPSANRKEEMLSPRSEQTAAPSRRIPPTIIASDVRILGNVISDGMLDIDGRIEGNVRAETIYIRENGVITGDVVAGSEVHIFGNVHGVIKAPRVSIHPSAHVEGAIMHRSISIEDGAYIDAQFKPFDAQPRIGSSVEQCRESLQAQTDGEDYDILKTLKLIS